LSPTYKNSNEKLQYQCSCGGIDVIDYEHFVRGHRCKHCRKERRQNAMMDNSGVTTSVAQKYLHQVFGGILNHNVAPFFLDIGFPESMIYIEYDGSGHDLCVKLNEISHEEFRKMELKRYFVLKNKGWKMIKFIAPNDYLPSVEVLLKEYNKALDWLSINEKNHSHYVVTFAGKTIDKKYGTMYRITGKEGLKYLNN
jgi:very-short-patch-repair endonuclease